MFFYERNLWNLILHLAGILHSAIPSLTRPSLTRESVLDGKEFQRETTVNDVNLIFAF